MMDLEKIRKEEKKVLERDYSLLRWYRTEPENETWRSSKIILTVTISLGLGFAGFLHIFLVSSMLITALAVGIGILIGGSLVNPDIRSSFCNLFKNQRSVTLDVHEGVKYCLFDGREDVILIYTKNGIVGMGLFELKAIPLQIKANLQRLINGLSAQKISIFWVYVQSALNQPESLSESALFEGMEEISPAEYNSWNGNQPDQPAGVVRVLFGIQSKFKMSSRVDKIYDKVSSNLRDISKLFRSCYPHSIVEPLRGDGLTNAFNLLASMGVISA